MQARKRLFFVSICLCMFASNYAASALGVLLSSFIGHYGLVSAKQGLIAAMQNVGSIFMCVAILFLAGRIKRQWILLIGVSLMGFALAGVSTAPPFFVVLILYFFLGCGYNSNSNVTSSMTSELYKGNRTVMCLLHAFFGMGGLVAPLVLRAVLKRSTWNLVCLSDAAVVLLIAVIYTVILAPSRPVLAELKDDANHITFKELKDFLFQKRNLLLVLATIGYKTYQDGINVWIVRYFDLSFSGAELGSLALSGFWIGTTLGRIIPQPKKFRTEILFAAGCLIAAVLLAAGIALKSEWLMFAFVALGGVTSGASVPQLYHMGCTWNTGNTIISTSVLGIAMSVGSTVTAPLTAALAASGMDIGMISVVVYALIGGVALLPVILKRDREAV